jgi:hypothetical protein
VHAAERDDVLVGRGALAGEAEGVADVVRDVLDLGQLVVVGEDDRAALGGERAHLGLQGGDVRGGDGEVDARDRGHRQQGGHGQRLQEEGEIQDGRRMRERPYGDAV